MHCFARCLKPYYMPTDKISKILSIGHVKFSLYVPADEVETYDRAAANANTIIEGWREKLSKQGVDYQYCMSILDLALKLEQTKDECQRSIDAVDAENKGIDSFIGEMGV